MVLVTGTYTGNGAAQSITGVGFQPDAVWVFRSESATAMEIVVRTSAMATTLSANWSTNSTQTNGITSLDGDGFSVGTSLVANKSGVTYHYAAWQKGSSDFEVGSYTGDGADPQTITVGFQPDIVTVFRPGPSTGRQFTWWVSSKGGDNTLRFATGLGFASDMIQGVGATTFDVGGDAQVNTTSETYYWMAWKNVTNQISNESYTGNGTDNRDLVPSDAFQAKVLWVLFPENSGSGLANALYRQDTFSGDQTFEPGQNTFQTNRIQAINSNGFQVGNDRSVNSAAGWTASNLYYFMLFASTPPPPPFDADLVLHKDYPDVLPHWHGYTVASY